MYPATDRGATDAAPRPSAETVSLYFDYSGAARTGNSRYGLPAGRGPTIVNRCCGRTAVTNVLRKSSSTGSYTRSTFASIVRTGSGWTGIASNCCFKIGWSTIGPPGGGTVVTLASSIQT
jgi:hypothetical protein